jgi:hypothetical protein
MPWSNRELIQDRVAEGLGRDARAIGDEKHRLVGHGAQLL